MELDALVTTIARLSERSGEVGALPPQCLATLNRLATRLQAELGQCIDQARMAGMLRPLSEIKSADN